MLLRSVEELSVGDVLSHSSIGLRVHPEERLSVDNRSNILSLVSANVLYLHPHHDKLVRVLDICLL